MNFCNYHIVSVVAIILLSFIMLFSNDNLSRKGGSIDNLNDLSPIFLQNLYAIEEKDDENNANNKDKDEGDDSNNNKKDKSIFNIVAVGDWDCTDETEDTVDNIEDQDPELVLALGDLSYNGKA